MNSDNLRASRLWAFVANKSTAFQAGFWRRFMPQNEFCGYENPAFQAENILKNDVSLSFDNKANLCLKGNNLHNRRYATCGWRHHNNPCLKGRTIAVVQMNIHAGRKRQPCFSGESNWLQWHSCHLWWTHKRIERMNDFLSFTRQESHYTHCQS